MKAFTFAQFPYLPVRAYRQILIKFNPLEINSRKACRMDACRRQIPRLYLDNA
jgi:hypothetical protein